MSEEEREDREGKYKTAKQLAKKAVTLARNKAYEKLYKKLETKESEKDEFGLARAWEKKTRDLGNVRCIKGEHGQVLVVENKD